jgi:hypothetical protein
VADQFNAYREWLGLEAGEAADYYELLGLARFAEDEKQVAAAAERARTKVRSFRPGPNARAWSQLLDEIQAARECLTDASKKAEYDERLRRGVTVPAATAETAQPAAAAARSAFSGELYPPGMAGPMAVHAEAPTQVRPRTDLDPPVRGAAAAVAQVPVASPTPGPASWSAPEAVAAAPVHADAALPVARVVDEYPGAQGTYQAALPAAYPATYAGAAYSPAALDPMAPVAVDPLAAAAIDPMAPIAAEAMLPPGTAMHATAAGYAPASAIQSDWGGAAAGAPNQFAVASAPTAAWVTAQRRRKSLRLVVLAVLGCVALIAATAVTNHFASKGARQAPPTVAENQAEPAPEMQPQAADDSGDKRLSPSPPPGMAISPMPRPANGAEDAKSAVETSVAPAVADVATTPGPAPATVPEPPAVTREEIQVVIKALDKAKVALAEQNFKTADDELAKAQSVAKLPKHQAAVARLREVGGYVKRFRDAVTAAVGGMQAGETFQVGGSTQVSYVEGMKDKVVLRINGMNRTYAFSDLPPGLALVIADFKLPAGDSASRVVKGAYLAVHKRADSETQDKAKALWQEAQAMGADTSHLMPLLSDDYASFVRDATAK